MKCILNLVSKFFHTFLLISSAAGTFAQEPLRTIPLWPGPVPAETRPKATDMISEDRGGHVTRVAAVTDPVIEVFEPLGGNTTGTGVVVCPGGGYYILAIDLEGYEIASWLNSLGITAFVLHYRVPGNPDGALQDARRAIRVVRDQYMNRSPFLRKIGIMGFSAGGSLSARTSILYGEENYETVSEADFYSARPDFTLLIYPAYLDEGPDRSLTPELKVDSLTPPMFIFETADDPYGNSALVMAGALRDHEVPVELHFLPRGGHGYGVRPGNPAAEAWPALAAAWLERFHQAPDPALPFRNSNFVETGGIKLHYRIWPAANKKATCPWILMVHGMSGSTYSWEYNAPVLAANGFNVLAVDVPPFGYSGKNTRFSQSAGNRAALLWKFLDQIQPGQKWILAGHSMGGGIVQAMAVTDPARVNKVVFVDPALSGPPAENRSYGTPLLRFPLFRWIAAGYGKVVLIRPAKIRQLLESAYGSEPPQADVDEYYHALSEPGFARAFLSARGKSGSSANPDGLAFNRPAIAIWGDKDTWVPLERSRPLLDRLPTIEVRIITGAGHVPMATHPAEFNRLALEFLRK